MSSIEWLKQQLTYQYEGQTLNKFYDWKDISEIYNKAKEMHKQEIIDALNEFSDETLSDEFCDKYYNETFNK